MQNTKALPKYTTMIQKSDKIYNACDTSVGFRVSKLAVSRVLQLETGDIEIKGTFGRL